MTRENIKNYLLEKTDIVNGLDQNILIANATQELYNEDLINCDFNYRECECDSWLQCEYFSEKLNHTIIVDYDVRGEYESIDDLIDTLAMYMEQVDAIEARII
ncbi:hypothetical protein [Methanoculleus sp.]|uniref:hypothetical protein n=1 Tax=Methanoculleus sp. TaxID=90427 RepID=UPI0025D6886C|nr:hypothetical protein [Methanoculleus sp.]MCK9318913.1 hypothetical protein [Methanoculleus sp.]